MVLLVVLAGPCLAMSVGPPGRFNLPFFVFVFAFELLPFEIHRFHGRFHCSGRVRGPCRCSSGVVIGVGVGSVVFAFVFAWGVPSDCLGSVSTRLSLVAYIICRIHSV